MSWRRLAVVRWNVPVWPHVSSVQVLWQPRGIRPHKGGPIAGATCSPKHWHRYPIRGCTMWLSHHGLAHSTTLLLP